MNRLLTDRLLVDLMILAKDKPRALAWLACVVHGVVENLIADQMNGGGL